jgi:hypothetical protein
MPGSATFRLGQSPPCRRVDHVGCLYRVEMAQVKCILDGTIARTTVMLRAVGEGPWVQTRLSHHKALNKWTTLAAEDEVNGHGGGSWTNGS